MNSSQPRSFLPNALSERQRYEYNVVDCVYLFTTTKVLYRPIATLQPARLPRPCLLVFAFRSVDLVGFISDLKPRTADLTNISFHDSRPKSRIL